MGVAVTVGEGSRVSLPRDPSGGADVEEAEEVTWRLLTLCVP